MGSRAGGIGNAANDEFLTLHTFYFQPIFPPARAVRLVLSLRHDAFQTHSASLLEKSLALPHPMLAISQGAAGLRRYYFFEFFFTGQKRRGDEIAPVQVEQVKNIVNKIRR